MEAVIRKIPQERFTHEKSQGYVDFDMIGKSFFTQLDYAAESKVVKKRFHFGNKLLWFAKTETINDNASRVSRRLRPLIHQIEEAKEILRYETNWDEEGALARDDQTFGYAADFVMQYAKHIFNYHDLVIGTPYIDILKDGSVTVHWETDCAQLLIIFKKGNDELAYYYAERKDNKVPLKSAIEPGKPIDEFLALWMRKNLV